MVALATNSLFPAFKGEENIQSHLHNVRMDPRRNLQFVQFLPSVVKKAKLEKAFSCLKSVVCLTHQANR